MTPRHQPSGTDGPEEVAQRLCTSGLALAVCAAGALLFGHVVNHALFDGGVWNLDPASEGNAWTWASAAAVFACGFIVLVRAVALEDRRTVFGLLAAGLLFFSLDDAVQIHEKLGQRVGNRLLEPAPGYVQGRTWLVIYVPLLAFVALTLWRESAGPHPARRTLRLGLWLLVAAVASEALGLATKPLDRRGVAWPDILRVGIEEGIELAGWIVTASGLTALVYLALVAGARAVPSAPERE